MSNITVPRALIDTLVALLRDVIDAEEAHHERVVRASSDYPMGPPPMDTYNAWNQAIQVWDGAARLAAAILRTDQCGIHRATAAAFRVGDETSGGYHHQAFVTRLSLYEGEPGFYVVEPAVKAFAPQVGDTVRYTGSSFNVGEDVVYEVTHVGATIERSDLRPHVHLRRFDGNDLDGPEAMSWVSIDHIEPTWIRF